MADRVERLTNLLALLLETVEPLSLTQLADRLEGAYPDGLEARRGAFERDKAALRELGVPIETEIVSSGPDAGQTRYRVDRRRYELADLDLTDDERRALQVAVAATRGGSGDAQSALWKLGGSIADDPVPAVFVVPRAAATAALRDAIAARAVVRFGYRGRAREVEPAGLLLREGFWYLVGRDRSHGERRTFRVDRIDGAVEAGEPGGFESDPVDLRDAVPADPRLLPGSDGDGPRVARVRVSGPRALLVGRVAGLEHEPGDGGDVVVHVPFHHAEAVRSWILGLGPHAEVLEPTELRADVIEWLRSFAAPTSVPSPDERAAAAALLDAPVDPPVGSGRRSARRTTAPDRLRRLLVMLPWLMERGSVPLAEVATRFGGTEREVAADLELASVCGVPPYVDELIDVYLDDDTVHVGVPRLFTRPLRLTSIEAFEVLTAARAAARLPGVEADGALQRALDKLAVVVDQEPGDPSGVDVDVPVVPFVEELSASVRDGRVVELEYLGAADDEPSRRRVAPRQVFVDRGNWYLTAEPVDRPSTLRTFRVDRMVSVTRTDQPVPTLHTALPVPGEWFVGADVVRAVLRVRPEHRWIIERYPVDRVVDDDDGVRVVLPVVSDAWLERLLLRLGPDAVVEAPERWRGLAYVAAQRMLDRYADRP